MNATTDQLNAYAESILELNPTIEYLDFKDLLDNFTATTEKE